MIPSAVLPGSGTGSTSAPLDWNLVGGSQRVSPVGLGTPKHKLIVIHNTRRGRSAQILLWAV